MEHSNAEKTVVATLSGIAAGFLIGILIAPEKGSKTRKNITKTSNEYLEGIKSELNELRHELNKKIESTREEVEDLSEKSKKEAKKAVKKVTESSS